MPRTNHPTRGAFCRTLQDVGWRRRPRARLVTLHSGGLGTRSGGTTTAPPGAGWTGTGMVSTMASSQETRTRGQKSRGGAPEGGAPASGRDPPKPKGGGGRIGGSRLSAFHPLACSRGPKRRQAYPAPLQKIRAMTHACLTIQSEQTRRRADAHKERAMSMWGSLLSDIADFFQRAADAIRRAVYHKVICQHFCLYQEAGSNFKNTHVHILVAGKEAANSNPKNIPASATTTPRRACRSPAMPNTTASRRARTADFQPGPAGNTLVSDRPQCLQPLQRVFLSRSRRRQMLSGL